MRIRVTISFSEGERRLVTFGEDSCPPFPARREDLKRFIVQSCTERMARIQKGLVDLAIGDELEGREFWMIREVQRTMILLQAEREAMEQDSPQPFTPDESAEQATEKYPSDPSTPAGSDSGEEGLELTSESEKMKEVAR